MPPSPPYPIRGIVYDTNGTTGLTGVTMKATNKSTGRNTTSLSDTGGQYVVDAANCGNYSNGDTITIEVTKGRKIVQYITTINTNIGAELKNLTLEYYDILNMITDILETNWQKERTDQKTPTIKPVLEVKRIPTVELDLRDRDFILVYEMKTIFEKNSFGTSTRRQFNPVSIDMRSAISREHFIKVKREVDRIVNNKIINPTSTTDYLDTDSGYVDLSDRVRQLWRGVYDVVFIKSNESRGG